MSDKRKPGRMQRNLNYKIVTPYFIVCEGQLFNNGA
jgi:hypothetical protein